MADRWADAGAGLSPGLVPLADVFPTVKPETVLSRLVTDASTKSWFDNAGFTVWADISCMAVEEVRRWPGLGPDSVELLMKDLEQAALDSTERNPIEIGGVEASAAFSGNALGTLFPTIEAHRPIALLVTDGQMISALEQRGLRVWADLATLSLDEILAWNGIGPHSVQSLLRDLAHREPDSNEALLRAESASKTLGARFPNLDPEIPVDRLTTDTRLLHAFHARGIEHWRDLAILDVPGIESWRGIGVTSTAKLVGDLASGPGAIRQRTAIRTKHGAPGTREQSMVQMRAEGATYAAIGAEFGVSRERVRQILESNGGPHITVVRAAKAARAQAAEDAKRAEIDQVMRPLLTSRGAMTPHEVAEALGLEVEDVNEGWPTDLTHLRIRVGYADQSWTDEDLSTAIQEAALYEFPLTAKTYSELVSIGQVHGPSLPRITQRFGSWGAACDTARVEHGQTPRTYDTRWTDNEILAYARDYFLDPDWPSSAQEFDNWRRVKAPDAPSFATVRNRLGTWSNVKRLALQPEEQAYE